MKTLSFSYYGEINPDFVNALSQVINNNLEGFEQLQINISSPGGETSSGITAYNLIKSCPVPVHVHNMGEVSSSAILVFLAGSIRTAANVFKFTFHPIGVVVNGALPPQTIEEKLNLISSDMSLYSSIVRTEAPAFCEEYDIKHILKHETVTLIDPEKCIQLGILTDHAGA